jgi:hypothetical protein
MARGEMTPEAKAKESLLLKAGWDIKGRRYRRYYYPDRDKSDPDMKERNPYTLDEAWALYEEIEDEENAYEQICDYDNRHP